MSPHSWPIRSGSKPRSPLPTRPRTPFGSAAQTGACTISFYGLGAPPSPNIAVPGGTLAAGASTTFLLSALALQDSGLRHRKLHVPAGTSVGPESSFAAVQNRSSRQRHPFREAVGARLCPRSVPARQAFAFSLCLEPGRVRHWHRDCQHERRSFWVASGRLPRRGHVYLELLRHQRARFPALSIFASNGSGGRERFECFHYPASRQL